VDGVARFGVEDTILVGDDGSQLMDAVVAQIEEQRPEPIVDRLESREAALYRSFLVGDGCVLMGTSGDAAEDARAADAIGRYFHPLRHERPARSGLKARPGTMASCHAQPPSAPSCVLPWSPFDSWPARQP
jgi:hypothetical protein